MTADVPGPPPDRDEAWTTRDDHGVVGLHHVHESGGVLDEVHVWMFGDPDPDADAHVERDHPGE